MRKGLSKAQERVQGRWLSASRLERVVVLLVHGILCLVFSIWHQRIQQLSPRGEAARERSKARRRLLVRREGGKSRGVFFGRSFLGDGSKSSSHFRLFLRLHFRRSPRACSQTLFLWPRRPEKGEIRDGLDAYARGNGGLWRKGLSSLHSPLLCSPLPLFRCLWHPFLKGGGRKTSGTHFYTFAEVGGEEETKWRERRKRKEEEEGGGTVCRE